MSEPGPTRQELSARCEELKGKIDVLRSLLIAIVRPGSTIVLDKHDIDLAVARSSNGAISINVDDDAGLVVLVVPRKPDDDNGEADKPWKGLMQ